MIFRSLQVGSKYQKLNCVKTSRAVIPIILLGNATIEGPHLPLDCRSFRGHHLKRLLNHLFHRGQEAGVVISAHTGRRDHLLISICLIVVGACLSAHAEAGQFGTPKGAEGIAAKELGVDPSTWSAWESGGTIMSRAHRHMVATFIGLSKGALYSMMQKRWNDSHGKTNP